MKLEVSLKKQLGRFSFAADFTAEGRRIGVFGPSGSGKTTLMNMLSGLFRPDDGFIRLDGETLFDAARKVHLRPEKRHVGVVFQSSNLFPHMSVRRNLFYGHRRVAGSRPRIKADDLIDVLNLAPLLDRGVGSLSGGEAKRVALGRTILGNPRLILMDEPLNGLDDGLKYQIIPYLKNVFKEFAIPFLFISHSLNEMQMMAEQVLEFENGRFRSQTAVDELALRCMGSSPAGFMNLLELEEPRSRGELTVYRWGGQELVLLNGVDPAPGMFELSSKDITLFKRHPEASSARNLLHCRVRKLVEVGSRVGVELDCMGQSLVGQVVGEAVEELGLAPGTEVMAAIKASAFRRLY
jgi:molybdate transport system ATP-binding protein